MIAACKVLGCFITRPEYRKRVTVSSILLPTPSQFGVGFSQAAFQSIHLTFALSPHFPAPFAPIRAHVRSSAVSLLYPCGPCYFPSIIQHPSPLSFSRWFFLARLV